MDESVRKGNKIKLDQGSQFYDMSVKSQLLDNEIEMYLTLSNSKFVVAQRFIRTLKNKIYRHITAVSKNVYVNRQDKIHSKQNKTYHGIKKRKPADVQSCMHIEYGAEHDTNDQHFKIDDRVKISKWKNSFIFLLRDTLQTGFRKSL